MAQRKIQTMQKQPKAEMNSSSQQHSSPPAPQSSNSQNQPTIANLQPTQVKSIQMLKNRRTVRIQPNWKKMQVGFKTRRPSNNYPGSVSGGVSKERPQTMRQRSSSHASHVSATSFNTRRSEEHTSELQSH